MQERQLRLPPGIRTDMKTKPNGQPRRVELGCHIVADPKICGGRPTFKGARIMVWIVLEQLDRALTWAAITREWDGDPFGRSRRLSRLWRWKL